MAKRSPRRLSGDGGLYQRADGMWVATLELGATADGRRRRWTAKSRTHEGALEKLRKARHDLATYGDMPTASPTVEDWLTRWLRDIVLPNAKPRTYDAYASTVRVHIVPAIGKVRLNKLTPAHVRRAMHGPLSAGQASTAAKIHRTLSTALTAALREGQVPRNVAQVTAQPKALTGQHGALTTDQARALLASTLGTPLHTRWMTALLTGLRQGECLGMEWDRIDLDAQVADIAWQLQRLPYVHGCTGGEQSPTCGRVHGSRCPDRQLNVPPGQEARLLGGSFALVRPKTSKSQRLVPLPPPLVVALRAWHEQCGRPSSGLVWTREDGRPIEPKDDRQAWDAALRAAGLPDVRLHDARATTATLLMEAGVDVRVIEELLGHTSVVTTRGYQRVSLATARQALDGLGESLASGGGPQAQADPVGHDAASDAQVIGDGGDVAVA